MLYFHPEILRNIFHVDYIFPMNGSCCYMHLFSRSKMLMKKADLQWRPLSIHRNSLKVKLKVLNLRCVKPGFWWEMISRAVFLEAKLFKWKMGWSSVWTWIYRWLCKIFGGSCDMSMQSWGILTKRESVEGRWKFANTWESNPMVAIKQGINPVCYGNKMKTPGKKSMDQTWHRTFFRTSSSPKTPQKDRSFWGVFVAKGKASDIPLPRRGLQRNVQTCSNQ